MYLNKKKGKLMKKLTGLTLGLSIVASTLLAGIEANIELDPIIEEMVSGKRILVNATIEDNAGLDVVRTYFKSADGANYSFVPMNCESNACSATLPAPSAATKSMDYLVLVKNADNVVYKTQTFNAVTLPTGAATPDYQIDPSSEAIQVKTELTKAPAMVEGFSDNVAMDTVDSSLRFGAVAGITSVGSSAAAGGAAAASTATGATAGGTVAATSAAAMTTTAIVGTTVAVVAGGAAVASASDSGSSSEASSSEPAAASSFSDVNGDWTSGSSTLNGSPECSSLTAHFVQSASTGDIQTGSYYTCDGNPFDATGTVVGTSISTTSPAVSESHSGTVTTSIRIDGTWSNSSTNASGTFHLNR